MEREELLEIIKQGLKFESFAKTEQEQIDAYLEGKTDKVGIPPRNRRLYNTEVFHTLEREIDTEEKTVAERGFSLFFMIYPSEVMQTYCYRQDRFYIFWKFHVPQEAVQKSIFEEINRFVKYRGGSLYQYFYNWKADRNKPIAQMHELTHLFTYFPDLVNTPAIINGDLPTVKMGNLVLCVLNCIWYEAEEEKRKVYLAKLEQWVYGILKQTYGEQAFLQDKKDVLFAEASKKFVKETKRIDIFYDKNILYNAIFNICKFTYHWSPLLFDAYRFCMLYKNPISYLDWYHEKPEVLCSVFREFSFPKAYDIKLYAELLLDRRMAAHRDSYHKALKELLETDPEAFLKTYQACKKEKSLLMFLLLAMLLKAEAAINIKAELLEAGERFIVALKKMEAHPFRGKESFHLQGVNGKTEDFSLLLQEELPLAQLELTIQSNMQPVNQIVICAGALFSYAAFARNSFCLVLACKTENWTYNYMQYFITLQKWFGKKTLENPLEILAKTLPVSRVIEANLYGYQLVEENLALYRAFLKKYPEESLNVLQKLLAENSNQICLYINALYGEALGFPIQAIVPVLEHRLKTVVNTVEELLKERQEAREFVILYLKSKNKNAAEAAARLVRHYDSAKVVKEMEALKTPEEMEAYLEAHYEKANDRKISYLKQVDLSKIRYCTMKGEASSVFVRYLLSEYLLLKDIHSLPACNLAAQFLNRSDLQKVLFDFYQLWLEDGADTKKKNILLPFAVFASDAQITGLKKQIDTWAENSRGALAAFAVRAMALNGGNIALMLVDSISAKYKNKQVRNAAAEAMLQAAEELHLTKEELGDKIVPDLGFQQDRTRIFSYGERSFIATLSQKLEITLTDEKGKTIKSLPKPNASDDTVLAEQCKDALKGLKKQLKTVVTAQKNRLEQALITGRKWKVGKWQELFIKNPIMNGFAIGLIWKEQSIDGTVLGNFRYMEDGSFNTYDEEEYQLTEGTDIVLLHPFDLEEEQLALWKEQLADYEIVQPIMQLALPVYTLWEEEKEKEEISRFVGVKVYFGTIRSVMEKYDWSRTSIVDGGGYDGYYYEDQEEKIGVQLRFDFLYVGMTSDELVKMDKMEFYKIGTIQYGSYQYDEINDRNRIQPEEVPPKILSFALMAGELIKQKAVI